MSAWGYFFIGLIVLCIITFGIIYYEIKHAILVDPDEPFLKGDMTKEQLNN